MKTVRILLITANATPIPAVKGGATETMMTHLIDVNEVHKDFVFRIINPYDEEAERAGSNYKMASFRFYKSGRLDKYYSLIFRALRKLTRGKVGVSSLFIKYCGKQISDFKPDLVLVEGNYFQVTQLRKYVKNCPLILHIHIDGVNKDLDLAKRIVSDCDGIITISDYCRNRVVEVKPEDKAKVKVLKNTIDTDKFSPQPEELVDPVRTKLGIQPDDIVITYCGRLCEDKGVLHLLKSVDRIKHDNIKLLIIGTPAYKGAKDDDFVRELKSFAQTMSHKVIFTGYIPQTQLPIYYNLSSIFVLPSTCNEAAGNVLIEAMSCGVPVVSTTQGGIPEYADKRVSLLVDADSQIETSLQEAIDRLIIDKSKYDDMAKNARSVALQYDKNHYYSNFKGLIASFLKR